MYILSYSIQIWSKDQKTVDFSDDYFVFTRGVDVIVFTTNQIERDVQSTLKLDWFKEGDKFCNALDQEDCVDVKNLQISIQIKAAGDPKIYILSGKEEKDPVDL